MCCCCLAAGTLPAPDIWLLCYHWLSCSREATLVTPGRECPGSENYQHILSGLEFQNGPQISTGVWWATLYWGLLRALFWHHCWLERKGKKKAARVWFPPLLHRVSRSALKKKKSHDCDPSESKSVRNALLISMDYFFVKMPNRGVCLYSCYFQQKFYQASFRFSFFFFLLTNALLLFFRICCCENSCPAHNNLALSFVNSMGGKCGSISKVVFDNPSHKTLV